MTEGEKNYIQFVGDLIKNKRKSWRYSQSELGDILGISHAQIGYFEKGKSVPSILQIYKLKKELNITDLEMSDLFKDITYYGKVLKKKRLSSRT